MANLSKRTKYFSTIEDKKYSILEAVDLLKSSPKTNFIASKTLALVPMCPYITEKNMAVSKLRA